MHHLFKNVRSVVCSTNIAGTTLVTNGAIVDTRGYRGLAFEALLGTLTTGTAGNLHAEGANTSATSDMTDIEDSAVYYTDAVQGASLLLDLGRPIYRWCRPVVLPSAAANTAISALVAKLYNPVYAPVAHSTDYVTGSTYLTEAATGVSTGS